MNLPEVLIAKCLSCLDSEQILENLKTSKNIRTIFKKYSWMIPLNFSCMTITDADLKYVEGVHTINLQGTNISDDGLKYLSSVKKISLYGCHGILGDGIQHLTNVLAIDLPKNITDDHLKYLTNAHIVDLYKTKITGTGLKYLKNVKMIDLAFMNITGVNYMFLEAVEIIGIDKFEKEAISKLKHLKGIYCWGPNLSQEEKEYLETTGIKYLGQNDFIKMFKCA